jgi:hypothetical protein
MDKMLGCEVLFGEAKAARIQARVEDAIGDLCPCKRDLPCPLTGAPLRTVGAQLMAS